MKEVIVENQSFIQEIKEQASKIQQLVPVKTNYYLHFHDVNEKNIHLVPELATKIWNECYKGIISQEQIDYMLDMMYSTDKINENITEGDHWKILKADNEPVGYIHFKEEENKIFLSKIYLLQEEKYKGLGQSLLNEVIKFAIDNNYKSIYLTVNKNNAKAIRFYEKNNFKQVKSETFDIGNGYVMDDFIYEKNIVQIS
ncbi:GNAT family N-acetyltransferase [Faecalibacter bovis]|uniref:GNAT family N-acetyltransferase n=2 Tax=Faecalibacter bovis TaxID=2898187 RepID=A0ABX7XGU9_9FLAO|nr:GNAT family N-acetyltransferase [Faecalibacter bovis]